MEPSRLFTRHVYLPEWALVSSSNFNVHMGFFPWLLITSLSFNQAICGIGFPVALHLNLTELETGLAKCCRFILSLWTKCGEAKTKRIMINIISLLYDFILNIFVWLKLISLPSIDSTLFHLFFIVVHWAFLT